MSRGIYRHNPNQGFQKGNKWGFKKGYTPYNKGLPSEQQGHWKGGKCIDKDGYILNSAGFALAQDREPSKAQFMWSKAKEALEKILRNQNSKLGPDFRHKWTNLMAQAHRA